MMLLATLLMLFADDTPQPASAQTSGAITVPGEFETTDGPELGLPRLTPPAWHASPTWMVARPPVPPPAQFDVFSPVGRPPQEFPSLVPCPPVALVPCPAPAPALLPPALADFRTAPGFRLEAPPQSLKFFSAPFAEPPAVRHVAYTQASSPCPVCKGTGRAQANGHVHYTEASGEFQVASHESNDEDCKGNCPAKTSVAQPDRGECPVKAFWQHLPAGPQAFAPPFIDAEMGRAIWEQLRAGHPPVIQYHPPHPVALPVPGRPPMPHLSQFPGAKSVEHFVRAKYDVPHETAKALEPILEQSAGVLGCIVEGDELTVNAAPPTQASIAQFLAAVVTKPHKNLVSRPVPAISASHVTTPRKTHCVDGPFKNTSETSAKAKCCNGECDCKNKCDCNCSCGKKEPATGPSARIISNPILNKIPYVNRLFKNTGTVRESEAPKPHVFHFSVGFARQTETLCPNGNCAQSKCSECATTKCAEAKCSQCSTAKCTESKCSNAKCESCGKKESTPPSAAQEEITALKQVYHNLGYFDVQIKPSCNTAGCNRANCESCSKGNNSAQVQLSIDKGVRYRVRNIHIYGTKSIDKDLLRANMTLEQGHPFNGRQLVRDVNCIKQNFDVSSVDAVPRFLDQPGVCDLVYQIVEGKTCPVSETSACPTAANIQPVQYERCEGTAKPATSGQTKLMQITIRATSDGVELTTSNGTKLHAREIRLETNHIGRLFLQSGQDSPKPQAIQPAKAEKDSKSHFSFGIGINR